jgi:CheY-like chemotaxis protein
MKLFKKYERPDQEVIGVIRNVDISGREITLIVHGAMKAFSVPTECSILLHGEPVKLRMLLPGDYARVAYRRGREALEARSIQVNWWLPLPKGGRAALQGRDQRGGAVEEDGLPARNLGVLIANGIGLTLVLLKLELEGLGFNVWLAQDSEAAVDLYRRYHDDIDLVLLDVQLPGRGWAETLAALREINPEVCSCLLADGRAGPAAEGVLDGTGCVLTGPILPALAAQSVQRLVTGRLAASASSGA